MLGDYDHNCPSCNQPDFRPGPCDHCLFEAEPETTEDIGRAATFSHRQPAERWAEAIMTRRPDWRVDLVRLAGDGLNPDGTWLLVQRMTDPIVDPSPAMLGFILDTVLD